MGGAQAQDLGALRCQADAPQLAFDPVIGRPRGRAVVVAPAANALPL